MSVVHIYLWFKACKTSELIEIGGWKLMHVMPNTTASYRVVWSIILRINKFIRLLREVITFKLCFKDFELVK